MNQKKPNDAQSLAWTGERMVPHLCDGATEMFHWQRYLYFRPLYKGKKVIDAASGEGYGLGYAATFAEETLGFDIDAGAVKHANARYPHARFAQSDVCAVDYSQAEVVTSFETIEHLPDPEAFLDALAKCQGTIIISTPSRDLHSPGNRLQDKPLNKFHTIEWTPAEFAEIINNRFGDRRIQYLSQEALWPGRLVEGLDLQAMYTIAVIGDTDLPIWPSIGFSMPMYDQVERAIDAISTMAKSYPGRLDVCVVCNGTPTEKLEKLKTFAAPVPESVQILELPSNIGYGRGANIGLSHLLKSGHYDLLGVTNDDVIPATDCISQMVDAYTELKKGGQNPGLIAPVSNSVAGNQMVNIGAYTDYQSMMQRAELWHRAHHSSASVAVQVRGLFFLMDTQCLHTIGGFDPQFGLGNFEDDDLNIRVKLAGYTLWIVDGSFLHHEGSSTFKSLKLDYNLNMERNLGLFCEKWKVAEFSQAFNLTSVPAGVHLFIPLDAEPASSGIAMNLHGEKVDIVHQATEIELAAWLVSKLSGRPRSDRYAIVEAVEKLAA